MTTPLDRFAAGLPFPLDDFQVRACAAVQAGSGVLVAAPTGSGKTLVGEFALTLALESGGKAFYTTPIKALSNQKYLDFGRRFGADHVGLLTGDSSINGDAPIVVMTTEVLRNMLYAGSPALQGLTHVVMDEVHYLADRSRGAVWEEVIIHLPDEVSVISLSATVSNAEEFGDWLADVRGEMTVVVSEERTVPLWQHLMVEGQLLDLFVGDGRSETLTTVNPILQQRIRATHRPGGRHTGTKRPSRADTIRALARDALLPAIIFIFSRTGCEGAVEQLIRSDLRLIDEREGERIRRLVEERCRDLPPEDLGVLGYYDFVDGLTRGFAAHHAGMVPTFREIVEELFTAGRLQVVYATETLALGINMPARTVLLERLVKFNGSTHAQLTPAEFTQLTGRAGRRGIDLEGHAVVLWQPGLEPASVAGLASTRTYPLISSFRPTPNMALNLVGTVGRSRARDILETSFAQFQADRSVVGIARAIRRNAAALRELEAGMTCELGDFTQYAQIRAEIRDAEKRRTSLRAMDERRSAVDSLAALRIGDVVWMPVGRRSQWAVVITPQQSPPPSAHRGAEADLTPPAVVTEEKQLRRINVGDLTEPVVAVTSVRLPKGFNPRSPASRRDLATTLRIAVSGRRPGEITLGAGDESGSTSTSRSARSARSGSSASSRLADIDATITALRARLRAHPCHQCPDRETHARIGEQWWRVHRDTEAMRAKVAGRTGSVAATFDGVCRLLADLGYLSADLDQVTRNGQALRHLYTERALLVAEALGAGVFARLDAPSLAAVISALVHDTRPENAAEGPPRMPSGEVREALRTLDSLWARLDAREEAAALPRTRRPDPGIVWVMHRWAAGARLEVALRESELSAGDFVRRCKQVVDLLGQLVEACTVLGHDVIAATARRAAAAVLRGVVAADRLD